MPGEFCTALYIHKCTKSEQSKISNSMDFQWVSFWVMFYFDELWRKWKKFSRLKWMLYMYLFFIFSEYEYARTYMWNLRLLACRNLYIIVTPKVCSATRSCPLVWTIHEIWRGAALPGTSTRLNVYTYECANVFSHLTWNTELLQDIHSL